MEPLANFERQENTNSYSRAVTYLDEKTTSTIEQMAKSQSKSRSYILARLIEKGLEDDPIRPL